MKRRAQRTETWYAVVSHEVVIPHAAYPALVTAIHVMQKLHDSAPKAGFKVIPLEVIPPSPEDLADVPSDVTIDLTKPLADIEAQIQTVITETRRARSRGAGQ